MKKLIILTAISLFTASSAFAGTTITLSLTDTGKTVHGGKTSGTNANDNQHVIGKTSTGVGVGMAVDATAGAGYSVETQHKNGTKAFGSSFDSTSIYVKEVTAGTAETGTTLTTGNCFSGASTWTTL